MKWFIVCTNIGRWGGVDNKIVGPFPTKESANEFFNGPFKQGDNWEHWEIVEGEEPCEL